MGSAEIVLFSNDVDDVLVRPNSLLKYQRPKRGAFKGPEANDV